MARNKLKDLNDHLVEQMERLNDDNLKGVDLHAEVQRSKAMAGIAHQIIGTHMVILKAHAEYQKDNIDKDTIKRMTGYGEDEVPSLNSGTKGISSDK